MIIRSKNRLYVFDRHISDALLRLSVLALAFLFALTAWLGVMHTDVTISAVFWTRLQNLYADLTGSESTKLGTSEKSVYTLVWEQMEKDKALVTRFPSQLPAHPQ